MCPQTVYLEFVYRPLERLFDGPPRVRHTPRQAIHPGAHGGRNTRVLPGRLVLTWPTRSWRTSSASKPSAWVRRSPLEHPGSFLVMFAVTAA